MIEGILIVANKTLQSLKVKFINKNGDEVSAHINDSELSAQLLDKKKTAIAQLNGLEVELEEVGGQPKKIREKGQEWQPSNINFEQKSNKKQSKDKPNNKVSNKNTEKGKGYFHNPYNFIPAPSRNTEHKELGDHLPTGHGSYRQDYWSGRISVKLTTVTPLLIPDAANATGDDHKTYPIRIGADGKPYLPATSIKGMLRSAYEAVTNSRFSIFEKHKDRLAYRMAAEVSVVPARVESKGENLFLRVMKESNGAAKLIRYEQNSSKHDKGESKVATRYDLNNNLPQHGDHVWVKLSKGKVTKIRQWDDHPPVSERDWKQAWVCVTGANIKDKMYERVFVENENNDLIPLTEEIHALWKELICNYQQTHKKDLKKRDEASISPKTYLGKEPGKTAWSRHIWDTTEIELKEGTLCYVELTNNEITAVQPVTIARCLYSTAPEKLLDDSLKPALEMAKLSPGDRVFGWVNQKGKGSYKGNVRINGVTCPSDDSIEPFGDEGFPLAILGEPKDQQARFYQAKDKKGSPLEQGIDKGKGYSSTDQGLRGRKVYPHHHGLPDNHWHDPNTYRKEANNGHYQEYRQPHGEKEKTDQNRSIQAWVKSGVEFKFTIDVTNLSPVEIGALLWLLTLLPDHYHRLGGGKPLGFGSVHLAIDWKNTDLRIGQDWQKFYRSLLPIDPSDYKLVEPCIKEFKKAVVEAYGNCNEFNQVSFIAAFCRAAKGFDDKLPIHYPRTTEQPNPEGEGFQWFTQNESIGKKEGGLKLSLPHLVSDRGLPYNPTKS